LYKSRGWRKYGEVLRNLPKAGFSRAEPDRVCASGGQGAIRRCPPLNYLL
jgi:hypothetical protein